MQSSSCLPPGGQTGECGLSDVQAGSFSTHTCTSSDSQWRNWITDGGKKKSESNVVVSLLLLQLVPDQHSRAKCSFTDLLQHFILIHGCPARCFVLLSCKENSRYQNYFPWHFCVWTNQRKTQTWERQSFALTVSKFDLKQVHLSILQLHYCKGSTDAFDI